LTEAVLHSNPRTWLRAFRPAPFAVDLRERTRVVLGAFIGVLAAAALSRWLAAAGGLSPWLVAPLGASAVLVFAAPASPLAQPWSVVGGNGFSALVGVICAAYVPDPILAAAAAVALAIGAMLLLRCLHPPGGACALLAVLAHAANADFAVETVVLNSVLLVSSGLLYNSLTGRPYPHAQVAPAEPAPGAGFRHEDLDAVLARYNQVLDVSRDELEALLLSTEREAFKRRFGDLRCRDVMSREVVAVEFGSALQDAWALMTQRRIKALPVIDRSRRIVGIITMADFLRSARVEGRKDVGARLRALLRPDGRSHSEKPEVVGQIMTCHPRTAGQEQPVADLMALFADAGHHHIPIVDTERRLAGIVTQSDFVRALHQRGPMRDPRAAAGVPAKGERRES
jgi:CBS domain-containing membrane protein